MNEASDVPHEQERVEHAGRRIDLTRVDDLRDAVHETVECLVRGGVVALPTDGQNCFVALAQVPEAVGRLSGPAHAASTAPLAIALRSPDDAIDWVPRLSRLGRRMVSRAWFLPVTFLVSDRSVREGLARRLEASVGDAVVRGTTVGLRGPAHEFGLEVLRLAPGPVVIATGPHAPRVEDIDLWVGDGPEPSGRATTVHIEEERWMVLEPGIVDNDAIRRLASTVIVFVCTGNTCRSPMAEALFKLSLARRLNCTHEELSAHPFVVLSAGLAAVHGAPAASKAIEVVEARGASLGSHRSRPLTSDLAKQADWLLAMTSDHREYVLELFPELEDRVRLLDAAGFDIEDPIGRGWGVYESTAAAIERHVAVLLDDLGIEPS